MKYGYNSGGTWKVSQDRRPTAEYARWHSMMSRCYDPTDKAYPRYGGRGCIVGTEWQDFQVFAQWYCETKREGWVMDKDLLGGVCYSPLHVVWLPDHINQLIRCFSSKGFTRTKIGSITSGITTYESRMHLGTFPDETTAAMAYFTALRSKVRLAVRENLKELEPETVEALLAL